MKLDFFSTDFRQNAPVSKFRKNPSSGSPVVHADGRKDRQAGRHDEANSSFSQICANAPKNWRDDRSRYGHAKRPQSSVIQFYTAPLMKPEVMLDTTSCNSALCYGRFGLDCLLHLRRSPSLFGGSEGSTILRNVGHYTTKVQNVGSQKISIVNAWRDGVFTHNLLKDAVNSWDYTALNDTLIDPFYPKRSTELLHNITDSRVLIQNGNTICWCNQTKSMGKIHCAKGKPVESMDRTAHYLLYYSLASGKHVSGTMNPIDWDVTLMKLRSSEDLPLVEQPSELDERREWPLLTHQYFFLRQQG